MRPVTRIQFTDDNGIKFFGEGPLRLLRSVEQTGSLRAAAMEMGMAYSKATRLVRQAEDNLGFALTTRTTGGKAGGGSMLTPEGRAWLSRYEAYRDACVQENGRLYRRFFPKTGCVIMASGLGVRFGGNKLMADFGGRPMFLRAVDATEGMFDKRVVVTRHGDVARVCRDAGIDVILHDLPHRSDTVRLGLEALGDVEGCMFLPGDQPLLRRETVALLAETWKEDPDKILRPVCEGSEGSPVLFPAWAFPELKHLPEGKGGGYVLRNHPDSLRTVRISDPLELADADTPETLELLKGRLP
jgi:molybdate transport repressor ModE-like protein